MYLYQYGVRLASLLDVAVLLVTVCTFFIPDLFVELTTNVIVCLASMVGVLHSELITCVSSVTGWNDYADITDWPADFHVLPAGCDN